MRWSMDDQATELVIELERRLSQLCTGWGFLGRSQPSIQMVSLGIAGGTSIPLLAPIVHSASWKEL
jgi:hypothetical protein